MPDDLTDRMSRIPSRLPAVDWAPAAQLRRIGRNRRRRRQAAAAFAVVLAVLAGTGVGYRFVSSATAPIQPSTSDTPTGPPSPTPPPSPTAAPTVASGPVPPSVMLAEADLPAGYQVIDQITFNPASGGSPLITFVPTCAAYAELTLASVAGIHNIRVHTYFVGTDLTTPHIDETVIRFGSAEEVLEARARILRLITACHDPDPDSGAVFTFVMDGTTPSGQPSPQRWTVAVLPRSGLMAIVRTPTVIDGIGEAALRRLAAPS